MPGGLSCEQWPHSQGSADRIQGPQAHSNQAGKLEEANVTTVTAGGWPINGCACCWDKMKLISGVAAVLVTFLDLPMDDGWVCKRTEHPEILCPQISMPRRELHIASEYSLHWNETVRRAPWLSYVELFLVFLRIPISQRSWGTIWITQRYLCSKAE